MNYRLVLWDFDGTLADTLRNAVEIYNRIAPRHKALPMTDPEEMRGLTTRELIKRHRIRCHRFPFLIREFLAEQSRTMPEVKLYDGIEEAVETLTSAGVRQGIVSSNSEANIRACLQQNQVEEHFEFAVGMRRLFGKKRGLRQALKLAGLSAGEVLYVGDETRDILAARQIAIRIASVTWGVHSQSLLKEHRPDYLITTPKQLMEVVVPPEAVASVD